jgi:hypothetical protein
MSKVSSPASATDAAALVPAVHPQAVSPEKQVRQAAKVDPVATAIVATVTAMARVRVRLKGTVRAKVNRDPAKDLAHKAPLVDKATATEAAVVWVAAPKVVAGPILFRRTFRTAAMMTWSLASCAKLQWLRPIQSYARSSGRNIACTRKEADLNWTALR